MKYFLIAGEPSGDMHAATLMTEIKNNDPQAEFLYFGGDLMQKQGGTLLMHYRNMAYMGILPVLLNLRTIQKNFRYAETQLLQFNPDILILIDYPGFNLRMAGFAKKHNIETAYYISPKVWAWKTKRVKKIKKYVDKMYTIFPFETNFYKQYNYPVKYVGNPVWDIIRKVNESPASKKDFCQQNNLNNKPIIALLAGSRNDEINLLLPVMEEVAHAKKDYQFVIAGAPGKDEAYYRQILNKDIPIVFGQTYQLVQNSEVAIVASGTATLETALLKTPQIVVYKMSMGWFLEMFRGVILKTKFFSLVNLVAEKEIVKELFQSKVIPDIINEELDKILSDANYRSSILKGYEDIIDKLHSEGAALKAARDIVESIKR
ncbi:MAG: lipid-A-disaccharide synthase [Prolixibacteraceae bacterium]|jgi:lipid-A-disaccharide synthase|nr:lipid-A-disaccharide synthase [Prolixibacteraceae bacterium]